MSSDDMRRVWMGRLAMMVSPAFPVDAGKVLVSFLPDLEEFGDEFFTDDSRRFVARAPRRQSVPSYDEICRAFGEYFRANMAPRLALPPPPPPPDRVPPSPEEIAAVAATVAAWKAELGRVHRTATARPRDSEQSFDLSRVPPPDGNALCESPLVKAAIAERDRHRKGEN